MFRSDHLALDNLSGLVSGQNSLFPVALHLWVGPCEISIGVSVVINFQVLFRQSHCWSFIDTAFLCLAGTVYRRCSGLLALIVFLAFPFLKPLTNLYSLIGWYFPFSMLSPPLSLVYHLSEEGPGGQVPGWEKDLIPLGVAGLCYQEQGGEGHWPSALRPPWCFQGDVGWVVGTECILHPQQPWGPRGSSFQDSTREATLGKGSWVVAGLGERSRVGGLQ